ncbi:ATP-binding cassette domain-containing protein [Porticoccaceae bacterium]|nr:ATP-binding cassette domain-containing protein [Porticoccaceae bacterium]MDC1513350.1 ATP-binding cassette domain-containing protein [Porticoccaceae bacterium]
MTNSSKQSAPLFQLRDQRLQYQGRTVLDNLCLSIASGERVALIGESGSGKSTLLKALREQRPDQVAWCPQQPGLVPILSAFHNMYMGALDRYSLAYNLVNLVKPLPGARALVEPIAKQLGLEQQLFSSTDKLSGGQQQRTSIGRALIQQRAIFLGDEPVANVDEYQGDALLQLICQQHQTVVLALHDITQALSICTRIIGLQDGAIVLDAPSDQLQASDLAGLYSAS